MSEVNWFGEFGITREKATSIAMRLCQEVYEYNRNALSIQTHDINRETIDKNLVAMTRAYLVFKNENAKYKR